MKRNSPIYLLDSNVLIALMFPIHIHHKLATRWFLANAHRFATCPITQGSLIRFALRNRLRRHDAWRALDGLLAMEGHEFWSDDLSYSSIPRAGIVGHAQVTDAYLVALADHHDGQLATFDRGLCAVFPQAVLVS